METIIRSSKSISQVWLKASVSLLAFTMILTFQSCQKSESEIDMQGTANLKSAAGISETTLYYGHKIFMRGTGEPFVETDFMINPYFNCYDNLTLFIQNGADKKTRVSSAEISIDGVVVAGPSDFSKNVSLITIPLSGMNSESRLEVKLNSTPGSFIDIWIDGELNIITPLFTQIGPVVQDSDAPVLSAISENGITGTWNPETINTATAGIFAFTFTPDGGQCAPVVTMDIEIINRGSVTDVEGNIYATVKIGGQWWMAENLMTAIYNNRELIGTTVPAKLPLGGVAEHKYQWAYDGDDDNIGSFGRLYTWYAATDSRGVCPTGWRVPTDNDWLTLTDFLTTSGYGYEGSGNDIAKSLAATSGWTINTIPGNVGTDQASNNQSGFTGLPGGYRFGDGTFTHLGATGVWWSSTQGNTTNALYRSMQYIQNYMNADAVNKVVGASVRCVKN